jgi:hypothetical protein
MPAVLQKALRRRAFLQVLTAVPAFALFRHLPPIEGPQGAEEIVQVGGWILKRSEVA